MNHIYQFQVRTLQGQQYQLDRYQGRVMLIVNTASKCGFTPQFEGLEQLHKEYSEQGLAVLGFPCNQFGAQEPGQADEIATFCQRNYGVSFPMHEKIDVNGRNAHPLFVHLKNEAPGMLGLGGIKWNFTKFLVDRNGEVVDRYATATKPERMAGDIKKLLANPV